MQPEMPAKNLQSEEVTVLSRKVSFNIFSLDPLFH